MKIKNLKYSLSVLGMATVLSLTGINTFAQENEETQEVNIVEDSVSNTDSDIDHKYANYTSGWGDTKISIKNLYIVYVNDTPYIATKKSITKHLNVESLGGRFSGGHCCDDVTWDEYYDFFADDFLSKITGFRCKNSQSRVAVTVPNYYRDYYYYFGYYVAIKDKLGDDANQIVEDYQIIPVSSVVDSEELTETEMISLATNWNKTLEVINERVPYCTSNIQIVLPEDTKMEENQILFGFQKDNNSIFCLSDFQLHKIVENSKVYNLSDFDIELDDYITANEIETILQQFKAEQISLKQPEQPQQPEQPVIEEKEEKTNFESYFDSSFDYKDTLKIYGTLKSDKDYERINNILLNNPQTERIIFELDEYSDSFDFNRININSSIHMVYMYINNYCGEDINIDLSFRNSEYFDLTLFLYSKQYQSEQYTIDNISIKGNDNCYVTIYDGSKDRDLYHIGDNFNIDSCGGDWFMFFTNLKFDNPSILLDLDIPNFYVWYDDDTTLKYSKIENNGTIEELIVKPLENLNNQAKTEYRLKK